MLDHWLAPYHTDTQPETYTWGHHVNYYRGGDHQLQNGQCVLIGVDKAAANATRQELYQLAWHFGGNIFTDLGNLRKTSTNFVLPLLRELQESQLFPILIGSNPTLASIQFQSFLQLRNQVSLAVLDERVSFRLDKKRDASKYLNSIIQKRRESLFQLSLIGTQAHFTDPSLFDWLEAQNFTSYRLGAAREDLTQIEPIIRDADLLVLHLSALKCADAPGQIPATPSGFSLEEACQLCRYAGMSDKLRSFSICGFDSSSKKQLAVTAKSIAQLVFYFTEGFYQRFGDYPITNKGLTEYIVDGKGKGEKLTFWKSPNSGRWWLQVPIETGHQYQRHRLIPCSYQDYIKATQHELPDRLWAAFRRF